MSEKNETVVFEEQENEEKTSPVCTESQTRRIHANIASNDWLRHDLTLMMDEEDEQEEREVFLVREQDPDGLDLVSFRRCVSLTSQGGSPTSSPPSSLEESPTPPMKKGNIPYSYFVVC